MQSLPFSWDQVTAWRLAQHGLAPRLGRAGLLAAVQRMIGAQAQVMSAAELSLGARVTALTQEQVQQALWQDRTLVKTWAMRGTIHVFAAADLPLVVAARGAEGGRYGLRYFLQYLPRRRRRFAGV